MLITFRCGAGFWSSTRLKSSAYGPFYTGHCLLQGRH